MSSLENLETNEFKLLMQEHILSTIEYLFNNNQEFAIMCEIAPVNFHPELPLEIMESFSDMTIFMLTNYGFESATIENSMLIFETGFGPDNIGSVVSIPILAIKQIIIDQYPILINIASSDLQDEESEVEEQDSMSILLNNPENAKLLKKKKK